MQHFSYEALAPTARERLRSLASAVAAANLRDATELVQAGRDLAEAKQLVAHGQFGVWISAEFSWKGSTVRLLMSAARHFGGVQNAKLSRFASSAIYVLVRATVPDGARAQAVREAGRGDEVTYSRARKIVSDWCPITPEKVAKLPRVEKEIGPAPLTEQHRNWLEFEKLVGKASMVHISRDYDADGPDGETTISGRAFLEGEPSKYAVRRELAGVILYLAGVERTKDCGGCKLPKSTDQFSRDASQPDGRARCCRACESKRLAKYWAKRRRHKLPKGGAETVPPH